MRALVKKGKGLKGVTLKEVRTPALEKNSVLVRVKAVGICGTDLHIINDVYDHKEPLILGHEFCGEIAKVGDNVKGWKPGDRVVGELHTNSCRACALCRQGDVQICPSKRPYGTWKNGALADYFSIPAWLLHHIPGPLPWHYAAMIEPAACVMHAFLRAGGVKKDDAVLVMGSGPTGFLASQIAKNYFNVTHCFLLASTRRSKARFERIKKSRIAKVIEYGRDDPRSIIQRSCSEPFVDLVIDTSGNGEAIKTGIELIKRDGKMIAFGFGSSPAIPIPWNRIVREDITVTGSFSSNSKAWETVLSALKSKKLDFAQVLSHRIPFENWKTAFQLLESGEAMKIVIEL